MTFPLWIPIGPWKVHPHFVFESLAYIVGFFVYTAARRRLSDPFSDAARWSLVTAAALGAAIGAHLLFWLDSASSGSAIVWLSWEALAGKTAVGGLLGGWIAVELQKRRLGIRTPTGDVYAVSLALGFAIGRIGCFLTGLSDGTYGTPSSLPWAVDFGDGIPRHPTALYESVFMSALALLLWRVEGRVSQGIAFKLFMSSYLAFRLFADFIKPGFPLALDLTAIQWACLGGLAYYAWWLFDSDGVERKALAWPEMVRRPGKDA